MEITEEAEELYRLYSYGLAECADKPEKYDHPHFVVGAHWALTHLFTLYGHEEWAKQVQEEETDEYVHRQRGRGKDGGLLATMRRIIIPGNAMEARIGHH